MYAAFALEGRLRRKNLRLPLLVPLLVGEGEESGENDLGLRVDGEVGRLGSGGEVGVERKERRLARVCVSGARGQHRDAVPPLVYSLRSNGPGIQGSRGVADVISLTTDGHGQPSQCESRSANEPHCPHKIPKMMCKGQARTSTIETAEGG